MKPGLDEGRPTGVDQGRRLSTSRLPHHEHTSWPRHASAAAAAARSLAAVVKRRGEGGEISRAASQVGVYLPR
jgi:hypothetical protein